MSNALDMNREKQISLRKTVIASRGAVSPKAYQLIRSLPLKQMGLIALSANKNHSRDYQSGSYTCSGPSANQDAATADSFSVIGSLYELNKECASDGEQIETIFRNSDLVRAVTDMAHSDDIAMTALFDENNTPQCRQQIAKDAAAFLKGTNKPVLAAAGEYDLNVKGNLLVAAGEYIKRNAPAECRINHLADLSGAEVVVLYVANPFHPIFSKMAVGMRCDYDSAIREVYDTQVQEAAEEAMYLCETIRASGLKSWAIGKVGKFTSEVLSTAESCNCSLVCIPVDHKFIAHEKKVRSLLMDLLSSIKVPVLMLPEARMR